MHVQKKSENLLKAPRKCLLAEDSAFYGIDQE